MTQNTVNNSQNGGQIKDSSADSQNRQPSAALEKELAECRKQRDEYLAGWKRAKADFINYKNSEQERFNSFLRLQQEVLMKDLVGVLDSLDLSLVSAEGESINKKGIYLIKNQLADSLKKHGLQPILVKPGDKFDPRLHEAIGAVKGSGQSPGTIVEEVEAGYLLQDKVLRAAKVRIAE